MSLSVRLRTGHGGCTAELDTSIPHPSAPPLRIVHALCMHAAALPSVLLSFCCLLRVVALPTMLLLCYRRLGVAAMHTRSCLQLNTEARAGDQFSGR